MSRGRIRRITGVGVILLTGLTVSLFWGCKSKSPDASAKHIRIAGIVFQQDPFFQMVQFGMRDAAKSAGVELLEANSSGDPNKEVNLINTYVTQNVDAIVISPINGQGSIAALTPAHDQNIPIITYNSALGGDLAVAHIECSSTDLGQQTGKACREYIEKNLGGKAKIAIVAYRSQVPEQSDQRTNGFKSEVTKLPGVQIVAEQEAWVTEMSVTKVGDILTAHPDVNIIYAANDGGTTGAVLAVEAAKMGDQVKVFGTDCSNQLLTMLQDPDNVLQAITGQKPVDEGRMAVEDAIKIINHQPVDKFTSMPGILLSRSDPDGVKAFAVQFAQWTSGGTP